MGLKKWANPTNTSTYYAWRSMRTRCLNQKSKSFPRYGGRGIQISKNWLNDFDQFVFDMGERPKGMTLDRINNNGNYEPQNCRWVSYKKQQNNKSSNHYLTYNDETRTLSEWAEYLNIKVSTLNKRINVYKMPLEKAFKRRRVNERQHGTRQMYDKGKCKCSRCKEANAKHARLMRSSKR